MRINQLKAGVVLSYLSQGVSMLVTLLYTPIMLRLLGQSEYGLYQLVYSVVSYLGLLSFGFSSAYVRFYTIYKVKSDAEGIAKLNGMFMIVFNIIAVIALLAGFGLILNADKIFDEGLTSQELSTAKVLMVFMVINLALTFPNSVFNCMITAKEQFLFQRIVNMSKTILNPFLTLPLLLMGYKSISLVLVTTALTIIGLIINGLFCIRRLKVKFSFRNFDFLLLKEIWIFSFFIFLNIIVDQINWSVDKFILGRYIGTGAVAVYSIGAQINTMYLHFASSISSVFIPRVNKLVAENKKESDKDLTKLFARIGRLQFILLMYIFVGFVILGEYFIKRWAGDGYDKSYIIAIILMFPVTIPLIQNIGIEIQRAKNKHQFRSILYTAIALGNIVVSIILVQYFQEIGAAMGTGLTLLLGNGLIMNWYYHEKIGLNIIYFWKEILKIVPAIIVAVGVCIVTKLVINIDSIGSFCVVGVVYTACYSLCMWLMGFNAYEKQLVSGFLMKIRKS